MNKPFANPTQFDDYLDVTEQARRVGIKYPVLLDDRMEILIDIAEAAGGDEQNAAGAAWKSKPSWYILATRDRTVPPELQRFVAQRMKATVHEVASSHVPMLSHPKLVIDVIRTAADA